MVKAVQKFFTQSQIEAIARALGDTNEGLTGSEIGYILRQAQISDVAPDATKWVRLNNAFCEKQNAVQNRTNILQFIRIAMKPEKYIGQGERYETLRTNLNQALSFCGLEVKEDGELGACDQVATLSEAEERAISVGAAGWSVAWII